MARLEQPAMPQPQMPTAPPPPMAQQGQPSMPRPQVQPTAGAAMPPPAAPGSPPPPVRSFVGERVNSGQNGINIGQRPPTDPKWNQPYVKPQPVAQPAAQPVAQPPRQPDPAQVAQQQQRSQGMLRSAEEANLKGRQQAQFQSGLQMFGGDRTKALHHALKYGA